MSDKIRVTVWNEFRHEKTEPAAKAIYPEGIHGTIKAFLDKNEDMEVRLAALDDPDQGLPDDVLNNTDVLLWWGHMHHGEVKDERDAPIRRRVYVDGMGFIALHSAHHSKPFRSLVGATGNLLWGDEQKEIVWNVMPSHPIAAGVPQHFELPEEELYAEPFQIPRPDAHIFEAWYEHGYVFRTGVTFLRGAGKIFYFQPGHETCPSYHNETVQRIITTAVRWAKPADFGYKVDPGAPWVPPLV